MGRGNESEFVMPALVACIHVFSRCRKKDVDALAATVLLQQYLDYRRAGA